MKSNKLKIDPKKLVYQCFFCGNGIKSQRKDICALIINTNWDGPKNEQSWQQFYCHAECFQKASYNNRLVEVFNPDFKPSG